MGPCLRTLPICRFAGSLLIAPSPKNETPLPYDEHSFNRVPVYDLGTVASDSGQGLSFYVGVIILFGLRSTVNALCRVVQIQSEPLQLHGTHAHDIPWAQPSGAQKAIAYCVVTV